MIDTNTNTSVAFSCNHDHTSVNEYPSKVTDCNEVNVNLFKTYLSPSKIKSWCRGLVNIHDEHINTYNYDKAEQVALPYFVNTTNFTVNCHNATKCHKNSCHFADWTKNASTSLISCMSGPGSPNLDPMGYLIYESGLWGHKTQGGPIHHNKTTSWRHFSPYIYPPIRLALLINGIGAQPFAV